MKAYFHKANEKVYTSDNLLSLGIKQESAIHAGMYEIAFQYIQYDQAFYIMLPDGAPQPNTSETAYVQHFTVVPLPIETARANLKARIAALRYEVEMGGVDWTGADGTKVPLATDVDSRTRLQTAMDAAETAETVNFKLNGEFRVMTRAELSDLRDAVAAHVQACFDRESALCAAIDAAESVEALKTIGVDAWGFERTSPAIS